MSEFLVGVNDVLQATGGAQQITGACPYCSGPFNAVLHSGVCPRIKSIEYHPSGGVKRVELHPVAQLPDSEGQGRD